MVSTTGSGLPGKTWFLQQGSRLPGKTWFLQQGSSGLPGKHIFYNIEYVFLSFVFVSILALLKSFNGRKMD